MKAQRSNVQMKSIEKVMQPLQQIGIDYFTYCKYELGRCEMFSSDEFAALTFINDKRSIFPIEVNTTDNMLCWEKYCSRDYLDFITNRYNNIEGVTLVLRHQNNEAEHICLGSTNHVEKPLVDRIYLDRELMQCIISHIRNHMNFNREEFTPLSFNKKIESSGQLEIKNHKGKIDLHNREYIFGLKGPTYITRAERKCLLLLLQMKTSREIAENIGTTVRTVESHIAKIKKKLGAGSRHDIFRITRNNFISPVE